MGQLWGGRRGRLAYVDGTYIAEQGPARGKSTQATEAGALGLLLQDHNVNIMVPSPLQNLLFHVSLSLLQVSEWAY